MLRTIATSELRFTLRHASRLSAVAMFVYSALSGGLQRSHSARLLWAFVFCSSWVLSPCALSQGFPSKSIRLVTAAAPGSVPDTVARPLAERLGAVLHT